MDTTRVSQFLIELTSVSGPDFELKELWTFLQYAKYYGDKSDRQVAWSLKKQIFKQVVIGNMVMYSVALARHKTYRNSRLLSV